ncbi:MAG: Mov34/MPN/PAD-1 family protein [Sedimentisphaerales bacterium]|nr:Mov34/MPN/PAD-1 family protein [Sedimentisphaerales bacterium]
MTQEYFSWGDSVNEDELSSVQRHPFAKAVQNHQYAKLLEFRRKGHLVGIIIEICPERPQKPVADIRHTERLCVAFSADLNKAPEVLALRNDFPQDLPHLNLTKRSEPRSLCLFAQDFRDLRSTLTPEILLERIFSWLTRAALDQAHLPGQRLEPFLLSEGRIIFDPKLFDQESTTEVLGIVGPIDKQDSFVCQIGKILRSDGKPPNPPCFLPVAIRAKPWHARTINYNPHSLEELNELLQTVGIDIVEALRGKTRKLKRHDDYHPVFMRYKWILLLRLPKKREPGGRIESVDDIAFLLLDEIGPLGQKLGVLQKFDGKWGEVLGNQQGASPLSDVPVHTLRAISTLTPSFARNLSAYKGSGDKEFAIVGVGALGSQIVMNLARQGIGRWHIIDEDVLLPHNCVRHALSAGYVAGSKANAVANEIRLLFDKEQVAVPVTRDIFHLSQEDDEYKEVFADVDHIYDFSASAAVSRHLALLEEDAPRTSAFLLSDGKFLAILSEGTKRQVRLDDSEAQLPLLALRNDLLEDMFRSDDGRFVRYAGACRDITTPLPQDIIATYSAIASSFLKMNLDTSVSSIDVWKYDHAQLQVGHIHSKPSPVHVLEKTSWQVRLTEDALSLMYEFRSNRLPNETGGVLLGTFDIPNKVIYVVLVLPSPPDSIEWPTVYRRGFKGLSRKIDALHQQTGGNLGYVGEWHSHPAGVPALPSSLDQRAHDWLVEEMGCTGHPGLMLIKSDDRIPYVLLR